MASQLVGLAVLALGPGAVRAEVRSGPAVAVPGIESPASAAEGSAEPLTAGSWDTHRWDRYVRGFRREHNFVWSLGISSGTWTVRHFEDQIPAAVSTTGGWAKFQYSFHLPIYRGFGYFLGSSVGYHVERVGRTEPLRPATAWEFPGILAGVVLNPVPKWRFGMGFDAFLERHNHLRGRRADGDEVAISVTIPTYDGLVFLDWFYELAWALRLEWHRRHLDYQGPNQPASATQSFPVNAIFHKDDEWLGAGVVFHLL